ncbi:MAG: hypothetical protein H0V30_06245 [Chitinophagaceae bacterium]|jgi:hypothetical protein|nr:hypothetical protein [Chitinophagaceae bacterium]
MKNQKFTGSHLLLLIMAAFISCNESKTEEVITGTNAEDSINSPVTNVKSNVLDTVLYNQMLTSMSNNDTNNLWPVKTAYPLPGAILPFNRIVAYYGNLYSTRMGILGEFPKDSMFNRLKEEVANWQAAEPELPVLPALHYIAVTAQLAPGKDGKYRMRMPFHQIDTIMNWAKEINALVFVDIQIGHSSLGEEVPQLEKYLSQPGVHLGIDPEFAMQAGVAPGKRIGTFDAKDINVAIDYLAELVRKNNLPPKMLVIHRFTQGMVTNYKEIKTVPEVQIIMDMDGWGDKVLKRSTWLRYIYREPVQFAGFKIFYKNDTKKDKNGLYQPEELVKFTPKPLYIQYQ